MKKIKTAIVYASIAALSLAALVGYLLRGESGLPFSDLTTASGLPRRVDALVREAAETYDSPPTVGVAVGDDYRATLVAAIENLGGFGGIVEPGDVVLIKPNICTLAESGGPLITDYRFVQTLVDLARAEGASRVVIAEGTISGNAFSPGFLALNHYDLIEGAELVNLNGFDEDECYRISPLDSLTGHEFLIPKIYMDADVVINAAKLKTHFQPDAVVSLTLKNLFGVPPGDIYGQAYKAGLHVLGLARAIVDLNRIRRPDLVLIEGIVGGEGYGPLRNTPVDSRIVFAGYDPVAVDTVALEYMGFTVDMVPHVVLAAETGVGIADSTMIDVVGAEMESIRRDFSSTFKRR